jgi:uncharacterized membrane protein
MSWLNARYKHFMPWSLRYRIWSHVRSSLWNVPLIALLVQFVLKRLVEQLGGWMNRQGFYDLKTGFWGLDTTGASALLDRVFTLSLSCLVFTFGSLLVAIQVASGQYTPRIIATTLLRDNVIRSIVGLFVVTLLWANRTLDQIGFLGAVPQLQVFIASILGLASLIAFLALINYCARLLRPVSLAARIAERGLQVIENVYPDPAREIPAAPEHAYAGKRTWRLLPWQVRRAPLVSNSSPQRGLPDSVVGHRGQSGIVLALNVDTLVQTAARADCILEFVPEVGDFVGTDEPLFYVYGDKKGINEQQLRDSVALGSERTLEQDPMFAFRIEVDIALKALSPAINDPTTAVLVIDQLQRLLRRVGHRSLREEEIVDRAGHVRLVLRTPDWEDFVHITFREILQFGGGSLQVVRRLRAVILNLMETLPAHRHPALQIEMDLLEREISRRQQHPENIALARIPDTQGLGGASYGRRGSTRAVAAQETRETHDAPR